jgi:predicted NAD-dependent protein-ADP-ribosyltransferase YbiA (DUF1768 family)
MMTVKSKIYPKVEYTEKRGIEVEDQDHDSYVYIITLFANDKTPIDVAIAVGKYKFALKGTNVVYFPIYILSDNRIKSQIGVYETDTTKLPQQMIGKDEVDIELLGEPILYSFVTPAFIQRCNSDPLVYMKPEVVAKTSDEPLAETSAKTSDEPSAKTSDEPSAKTSDEPSAKTVAEEHGNDEDFLETVKPTTSIKNAEDLFQKKSDEPIVPLPEETEEDDIKLRAKYKQSETGCWVEKFLRNNQYTIEETATNGDCLFDTLRLAFESIGKRTSVLKLRQVVADRYNDTMFQNRKKIHDDILREEHNMVERINAVKDDIDAKKKKRSVIPSVSSTHAEFDERNKKLNNYLTKQENVLKELKEELKSLKTLKLATVGNLAPQTMRSLEDFRRFIMTNDYWADESAIHILEDFLNIKIVPFDETAYREKSVDNVVRPDVFLEENPILCTTVDENFNPDYYVLMSYSGNHYRLIEYKGRGAFKFHEIPYRVKILLVNKCMEKNGAGFYNIQDFRNFKSLLGLSPDLGKPSEPTIPNVPDESGISIDPVTGVLLKSRTSIPKYSQTATFGFNVLSASNPRPGKGVNEHISADRVTEFNHLHKIPNWRRKLSDEWNDAAFRLDNHMWASVEHYVLGSQFKHQNPSFYAKFSLDEYTEEKPIGKDVAMAKKLAEKPPHGIKPDVTYDDDATRRFRREALQQKFEQPDMNQLLRATKDAQLLILKRRKEPVMDIELMRLREKYPPL